MVAHKVWAADDCVTAVVEFQALALSPRVQSVTMMVNKTIKLFGRVGAVQETARTIVTTKHGPLGHDAVCVDEQQHRQRAPLLHHGGTGTGVGRSYATSFCRVPCLRDTSHEQGPLPSSIPRTPDEMTPPMTVTAFDVVVVVVVRVQFEVVDAGWGSVHSESIRLSSEPEPEPEPELELEPCSTLSPHCTSRS